MPLTRGSCHRLAIHLDARQQLREDREAHRQGVDRIEERLLVLLVVAIVGERLCLHERQQRDEVPVYAPRLAADQLGHVGIFFLRHDGRAGAEAVSKLDEAKTGIRPQNEFLAEARKVHSDKRRTGAELDRKIAIGDGIDRVLADAIETQLFCDGLAIDGERAAGQRGSPERQAVHALAAVAEPLRVPREHLEIGHEVMRKRHRLRHLHVGEPRHHRLGVRISQVEQRALQAFDEPERIVDRRAHKKPHVGSHLVVARAGGVKPLARLAGELDQPTLDIEVDVLVRLGPGERAGLDLRADLREPLLNFGKVGLADHANCPQHPRVGERALDVILGKPLVKGNGSCEMLHELGRRLGEPARPRLVVGFVVCGHAGC